MYNILVDTHLQNTVSGVYGYSDKELSYYQLDAMSKGNASITVASGQYIGVSTSLGMDIMCQEARLYCEQVASGFVWFSYKEFLRNEWKSHGDYNYNTDYSTPIMYSNDSPYPYSSDQTSSYSASYNAYKAFNQTATDNADCWHSNYPVSFPQSIMFYFPYGKVINKYALQCRNHGPSWTSRHFPRDFQLQGSVVDDPDVGNDAHWETLDSRESVEDPGQSAWTNYFTFENTKSYFYYRLRVAEANTESDAVALANLKLVEANRAESVPVYEYHISDMVWGGEYYTYSFPLPAGLQEASFYVGTSNETIIASGMALYTTDEIVSISGAVASGVYVDNYTLTHRTLSPLLLEIRNRMDGWAAPHILFNFTGVFDIDRNIFISPDYGVAYDKSNAKWYGLDYGYTVPEIDSFERGIHDGTKVEERKVLLQDSETEGSWRSPVLDTHNKSSAPYVYADSDVDVYIRASETPPPLVNFLIVTTDPTHRWLMYDHKRIYMDSSGEIIGSNLCDPPEVGSKIWRWADHDWAASDLMYYGSINEKGTACFVAPGYLECADISPEQEFEMPEYWYNFAVCKLDDNSEWGAGTTISGLPYGEGVSVVYTKTFPIDGSDGFFCFSITSDTNAGVSSVNLSFHQDGYTRGSYPLLTMMGNVSPSERVDIAYDAANNGWWVYLGSTLYKVDPGSINNIRIFSPQEVVTTTSGNVTYYEYFNVPDTMQGYIWKVDADPTWKGLVSIPSQDYSYFWVYGEKKIYLYEEKYQLNEPELVLHATIDKGVQVDSKFLEFHCGSCDAEGNLWMLDLAQERIIRVSLQKALVGDSRAVEYENQVAGVLNLWAHPTDGTCYLLISDEPEHPNQDIIRMVHVNQRWGSQGKYVCAVPGFESNPYKYGVSFVGKAFTNGVRPHDNSEVWGRNNLEQDGTLNTSTDYANPEMFATKTPVPYEVIRSSESGDPAWQAFNRQTAKMIQYAKEVSNSTGDATGWKSYQSINGAVHIGFIFDEPVIINKYAFAQSLKADWGLITVYANTFPAVWEFQGLKDEYMDSIDVTDDSQWDLIEYRRIKEEDFAYIVDTSGVDPYICDPWTPYFTCYNQKPRLAYRFRITHQWDEDAAGENRWSPYQTYTTIGEIKLVAAQEKLPWYKMEGGRMAPRGRYKQIKVDLSRESTDKSSPKIEKVRMPSPIVLEPLPKGQDYTVALKTTFNKVRTPGNWDTKLRVWWFDEEI